MTGPDADEVAQAATQVPGVARLHSGRYGEVATYLPGRRVNGVQVGDDRIAVHVVGRLGASLGELGDSVRAAVTPVAHGLPVDVVIEEVVGDDGPDDQ